MRSSFLRHSEVQTQLINLFAFAGEMERVDAVTKVNALTVPLCNAMIAADTNLDAQRNGLRRRAHGRDARTAEQRWLGVFEWMERK